MAESESDIRITTYTLHLVLMIELWGVYCGDFGENWLGYNGTTLYKELKSSYKPLQSWNLIHVYKISFFSCYLEGTRYGNKMYALMPVVIQISSILDQMSTSKHDQCVYYSSTVCTSNKYKNPKPLFWLSDALMGELRGVYYEYLEGNML